MLSVGPVLYYGCYATILAVTGVCMWKPLPGIVQMELITASIIYIGSHLSLKQKEIDPVSGEKLTQHETLTYKDAMIFPVVASLGLLSLYLAYKLLSPYWVNLLLTVYMAVLAVGVVCEVSSPIMDTCLPSMLSEPFYKFSEGFASYFLIESITVTRLISLALGLCVGIGWVVTKSWVLHNVIAISFSIQAIALISVGSFKIAFLLLSLLFFYDIFWVFATDVMVTVAKSFEGPIKIIVPRSFDPLSYSILGLGDIVIPGIVIAMALRFDSHLHQKFLCGEAKKFEGDKGKAPNSTKVTPVASSASSSGDAATSATGTSSAASVNIHERFQKLFFYSSIVSYGIGLATTIVIMTIYKAGQPALLYLVPACMLGITIPGYICKNLNEVFGYNEISENEKANESGETEEPSEESRNEEKAQTKTQTPNEEKTQTKTPAPRQEETKAQETELDPSREPLLPKDD